MTESVMTHIFSYVEELAGKKVVLFGAGKCGQSYYEQFRQESIPILAWVASRPKEGLPVKPVEVLKKLEYDVILIAVEKQPMAEEIRKQLLEFGVRGDKIIWQRPEEYPIDVEGGMRRILMSNETISTESDGTDADITTAEEVFSALKQVDAPQDPQTLSRYAEIVRRDVEAKEKMQRAYELDNNFFRITTDPGGQLTPEQLREVEEFWKPYEFAYRNDPELQRFCTVVSGKFTPCYLPWGLFMATSYGWNHPGVVFIRDKNYTELVFPGVKQAERYVRRINGYYYDGERKPITLDEACEICWQKLQELETEKMLLKPWEGGGARGIEILRKDFGREDIRRILRNAKGDYCCEEFLTQHESYAAVHPESINALRVMTLTHEGKVLLVGLQFHFGISAEMANVETNGLMVCVREDGTIDDVAFDELCNPYYVHPSGYQFAGKKLYNVDGAIEMAKKLHYTIPAQRVVTWEFAMSKDGEPILIEINPAGDYRWLQLRGYPAFVNCEVTKALLDKWLLRDFSYPRANLEWDYKEHYDYIELVRYHGTAEQVNIPAKLHGKPVKLMQNYTFSERNVSKIVLPASLKYIGEKAFRNLGNKNCVIIRAWEN